SAGSPSSRPPCATRRTADACTWSRRSPRTSPPSSTSSTGTARSSPPSRRPSETPACRSSTRPGSCCTTDSTAWGSRLRGRCRPQPPATLEALLLFLDFPPRLPLLFAALLPAAAPKRTPLAGLDFPAEVHREDEQDDHADDRPRDRIGLPPRLAHVDWRGDLVLRGDPRVRLRLVEDLNLQGLVSLSV